MELRIVDAEPRHLAQLVKLEHSCFSLPWTEQQLLGQLRDDMHEFLAAEGPEGALLGYVGMTCVLDEGYISNVAVDPACRRQGIGDRLIEAMLRRAEERELAFVTLEARQSNLAALRLYEKHGFVPVGRRKNYYDLPREDAVLMTKYLK